MHRALLSFCMIALSSACVHAAPPPPAAPGVRLVEFYTSEACASCLPADIAFARLAAEADVIALGFHVAYWNYLGAADRFALPVADRRQWTYAHDWHSGQVFTPEMIIDGTISGTGDSEREIADMMRHAKALPRIGITLDKGKIVAEIPALSRSAGAAFWIATFDRQRDIAVKDGENGGHVIHEVDIVRFARRVAVLGRSPQRIAVPLSNLQAHDGLVSFVQEQEGGPIIAAGRIYLDRQRTGSP